MSEPLLKIRNRHTVGCGDPPIFNNDDENYIGYFENQHGEQWVVSFHRKIGRAELRGGDIGWNTSVEVRLDGMVDGVTLNSAEQHWLMACLAACRPHATVS